MNTTLLHFTRDGEPLGSWPAFLTPELLGNKTISAEDQWWIDGMTEALPVSQLSTALTPQPAPVQLDHLNIGFVSIAWVVFRVILAIAILSPFIAVLFFLVSAAAVGLGGLALFSL
jgi:hypothetical protein